MFESIGLRAKKGPQRPSGQSASGRAKGDGRRWQARAHRAAEAPALGSRACALPAHHAFRRVGARAHIGDFSPAHARARMCSPARAAHAGDGLPLRRCAGSPRRVASGAEAACSGWMLARGRAHTSSRHAAPHRFALTRRSCGRRVGVYGACLARRLSVSRKAGGRRARARPEASRW